MRVAGACLMAVGLLGTSGWAGRAEAQAVAFSPTVGSFADGVSLSATPVVSADRRYVRLSVGSAFQTVDGFQVFGVPGAVSGGNGGGLRSVGVLSGMNGPIGPMMPGDPSGFASSMGPVGPGFGGPGPEGFYAEDQGNWYPVPRKAKSSRSKSARPKKAAPAPPAGSGKKKS